jgi:hypothetical protein
LPWETVLMDIDRAWFESTLDLPTSSPSSPFHQSHEAGSIDLTVHPPPNSSNLTAVPEEAKAGTLLCSARTIISKVRGMSHEHEFLEAFLLTCQFHRYTLAAHLYPSPAHQVIVVTSSNGRTSIMLDPVCTSTCVSQRTFSASRRAATAAYPTQNAHSALEPPRPLRKPKPPLAQVLLGQMAAIAGSVAAFFLFRCACAC